MLGLVLKLHFALSRSLQVGQHDLYRPRQGHGNQRACQPCHRYPEEEIKSRAEAIQNRTHKLLIRGEEATVDLINAIKSAKSAGANDAQLKPARDLQRKAQWRLDFIAAENSMGFHASQESARILAEAMDYARQGQVAAINWRNPAPAKPAAPATVTNKTSAKAPTTKAGT